MQRRAIALRLTLAAMLLAASSGHAQVVRQITDARTGRTSVGDMDDAGSVVYAISSTDPLGTNPEHRFQIFKWDTATGVVVEQVTDFADGVVLHYYGPAVSGDGQKIVFVSKGNLTGANPDRSQELFVMNTNGTGLLQLTDSPTPNVAGVIGYDLSGSGNRVVWASRFDHAGTNPDGLARLFVIDSDGTDLLQPTEHTTTSVSVSHDGERIAYSGGGNLRGIEADGTGDRAIYTSGHLVAISRDGTTLSFRGDGWQCAPNQGFSQRSIGWDGTNHHMLWQPYQGATPCGWTASSDITADGGIVFFASFGVEGGGHRWDIFRVAIDGVPPWPEVLTDEGYGDPRDCELPRVTDSGSTMTFTCSGGEPFGGPNPDHSRELYIMNGDGTNRRQLSDGSGASNRDPELTPDGAWIVFASGSNPLNEIPHPGVQIYRMGRDGSSLSRVTSMPEGDPRTPSITDDGSTIVFVANDPWDHVFAVQADGTGLVQLTPPYTGYVFTTDPMISGDGSVVVFHSQADLDGLNPSRLDKIFRIDPDGTGLAVLAPPGDAGGRRPRIDPTGAWVVYEALDIRRVRIDGSEQEELSFYGQWPDVSADAEIIVFHSNSDLTGSNPEYNYEIFRYQTASGSLKQVTFTAQGHNRYPAVSDDGRYVYFVSDSPHFETNWRYPTGIYRASLQSFITERVSALTCIHLEEPGSIAVNHDGSLAIFSAEGDCTEQNPDGLAMETGELLSELFLIDRNAPARIAVSPGPAPTVVSWDHESGPIRYDVIRGDVADLALPGDGTVDLGVVICLEDESVNADTLYYEDPDTPLPGQAFYYLYRGTQGVNAGPGSYGAGSAGNERTPSSGDCSVQ